MAETETVGNGPLHDISSIPIDLKEPHTVTHYSFCRVGRCWASLAFLVSVSLSAGASGSTPGCCANTLYILQPPAVLYCAFSMVTPPPPTSCKDLICWLFTILR